MDDEIRRCCKCLMQSLKERQARAEEMAEDYRKQAMFSHAMVVDAEASAVGLCIVSAEVHLRDFLGSNKTPHPVSFDAPSKVLYALDSCPDGSASLTVFGADGTGSVELSMPLVKQLAQLLQDHISTHGGDHA